MTLRFPVKAKVIDGPHAGDVVEVERSCGLVKLAVKPSIWTMAAQDDDPDKSVPYQTFVYHLLPLRRNGEGEDSFVLSYKWHTGADLNRYVDHRRRAFLAVLKRELFHQARQNAGHYDDLVHGETVLDGTFELDQIASALVNHFLTE